MKYAKDAWTLAVKQHKAVVHPCSIPDDILRTIFHWHVISEMETRGDAEDTLSSSFSPWTLSRVSRSWRALAISSPQLWLTINLVPQEILNERHRLFMFSKQSLVLHRSADCDLSICLTEKTRCRNSSMEQGIQLLLPTTRRWTYLKLSTRAPLLTPLVGCSFERLTELVWSFPFPFRPIPEMVSMFKNAHNLRQLSMEGDGDIDISWEMITVFSTDIFGLSNLPKLTTMESLTVTLTRSTFPMQGVMWRMLQDELSVSLSLPSVRSLSMIQTHGPLPFFLHISRLLDLPSSTSLTIISGKVPLPDFPGPLPRLRHLTLMSSAPLTEIYAFLDRYPSVTSFYAMNLHVLQLLPSILLPNLTSLRTLFG